MECVRDGDLDKLAALFERHNATLYNYYVRLTRDSELSEDLVQEVFLRILKYRHTFRGEGQFLTWFYHIARNVRIDEARRRNRESRYDEDIHEIADEPSRRDSPEFRDDLSTLEIALSKLPEEKRELIVMSRYQNLKYAAIADLLGCSVEAVKVRVHRAMNDLRKIFYQLSGEAQA